MSTTHLKLNSFVFSECAQSEKPTVCENETPKDFLIRHYNNSFMFGLDNLQRSGYYKLMGWAFDFRPFMRKYIIKQYGQWSEYFAPNKTTLRKSIYGRIDIIKEL